MLELFKTSLEWLPIYEGDKLYKAYNDETKTDDKKGLEEYGLSLLMQKLVELESLNTQKSSFDIDELIAKIDVRIAQLENMQLENMQFENTRLESVPWFVSLVPKSDFSARYCRLYILALLREVVSNPDDDMRQRYEACISEIPQLPVREIGYSLYKIALSLVDNDMKKLCVRAVKDEVKNGIRMFVEGMKFGAEQLELLRFFGAALFLIMSISQSFAQKNCEYIWTEAHAYLCYDIASEFNEKERPADGIVCAKYSLNIADPHARQKAFNLFGCCALETIGCKQLAYDAFFSWINRKIVGEMKLYLPANYDFSCEDEVWRGKEEGIKQTAFMHAQYAYVCGVIADTYERSSKRCCDFRQIAIEQIEKAIRMHPTDSAYCTYGTLLSEANELEASFAKVLREYQNYRALASDDDAKVISQRSIVYTMLDELQAKLFKWSKTGDQSIDEWAKNSEQMSAYDALMDELQQYQKVFMDVLDNLQSSSTASSNYWEEFFELHKKLNQKDDSFELMLLMLEKICQTIPILLQRREYCCFNYYTRCTDKDKDVPHERSKVRKIAYYTTLNTAKYLFDVLYRKKKKVAPYVVTKEKEVEYANGVNCLSMMHAHYMNDPCEGMVLPEFVSGTNPHANILFYRGDAKRFREDILRQYYVFLKSFTDKTDELLMWNRYASDKERGSKDSNGCCVQFSTDFFDFVNDSEASVKNMNKLLDEEDDYALYRVVYISQDGRIEDDKNPDLSPYVQECYDLLIRLLREVNEKLAKPEYSETAEGKEKTAWIREFVQSALRKVIFLFKHDDYAEESEYRLIVTRPQSNLDGIRLIPGEPDKLCVNPYFQICIDKIVLGPNVAEGDSWVTYFQYQLTRMWQRAQKLSGTQKPPKFVIEKSKIRYHT